MDIKETIILKLMIKKANIHFYLGKINHAEDGIKEAMARYRVNIREIY
jgi:hypothetical protein